MAKVMKNGGKACLRASHRQAVTVEDLKKAGVPIVPVSGHGIKKYLKKKPKSIEDVRRALSKLKVPLSEEIIRMREEDWIPCQARNDTFILFVSTKGG